MNPARNKGFTLVELLVVISIIAILSVIGIVVFTGIQKSSRDARRRGDINAIANVLEANKDLATGAYQFPTAAMFAGGAYPFDPFLTAIGAWTSDKKICGKKDDTNAGRCLYCFRGNKTQNFCGGGGPGDPWINDQAKFDELSFKDGWVVCANLEASPGYYCKSSAQ